MMELLASLLSRKESSIHLLSRVSTWQIGHRLVRSQVDRLGHGLGHGVG